MIGRFILPVPCSSSRVLAWLDARLKAMEHRITFRKAMYIWSTLKKNQNPSILAAFRHMLDSPEDKWTMSQMIIQPSVGLISGFDTKQELRQALNRHCIDYVMQMKGSHVTMQAVPEPARWFTLQLHNNDSLPSRVLFRYSLRIEKTCQDSKDMLGQKRHVRIEKTCQDRKTCQNRKICQKLRIYV